MKPSKHVDEDGVERLHEVLCPTCKRLVRLSERDLSAQMKFFPFCCERCKLIDLGAWLDADYRIPSQADGESEDLTKEDSSAPHEAS